MTKSTEAGKEQDHTSGVDGEDNAPLLSLPSFGLAAPIVSTKLDTSPGILRNEILR